MPNAITFANLLCGVTAIMLATQQHFVLAAVAIFVAGGCDVLDGILARRLRGGDDFGAALDSLADIISFGVAPGLLVYEAFLEPWPILGWLVAGGYVVCGAWRLARFAVSSHGLYFQGLPITMGGLSVAALLFSRDFWSPRLVALLTLLLAVLMVSHLRFPKLPMLLGRLPRPAQLLAMLGVVVVSLAFSFTTVLFAIGIAYFVVALLDNCGFWGAVADGPVGDFYERLRARL